MKAIVRHKYGSPDVLEHEEIDKPVVDDDDVLVRVHAVGLHAGDWHIMTGLPYPIRLAGYGLRKPKMSVPGSDFAGRVAAVGKNVTLHKPGDEVFGWHRGALAEYVCAPENNLLTKPANLTFEEAAAVPTSATTALQALRDRGNVQAGQTVLIIGASGGVGTFAVQIARSFGAHVTGVCSTRNLDMVRSIGAEHVIDYTREDFAQAGQQYELIVDTAGNRPLTHLRRALKPDGTLVLVGGEGKGRVLGGSGRQIRAMIASPVVRQEIRPLLAIMRREDVLVLQELLETGKVKPVIDRTYPLSEIREAMRYQQAGHTHGKVVITM